MKLKELHEMRNSLVLDMKNLVEVADNFDKELFEAKEAELKDIDNKIESIDKVEKLTQVENKIEMKDEVNDMEFKNAILEGKEMMVDFKNQMTSTNVKVETIGNGQPIVERANEHDILTHVRTIPVQGTSIVPVQKGKLNKLVKTAELASIAKEDVLFEKVDLRPEKYSTIVEVSEELIENAAFDIEAQIVAEGREAIDSTLAEMIVKGNDTAFGLEKATAIGGSKEVNRKAPSALALEDINGLYFALESKFRKNAIWVVNDADLRLLMTLADNTGRPLLQQDLSTGFGFKLYGRPVVVSNDATKMYFVDIEQAMVCGVGTTAQVKKSTEAMFNVAGVAFRVTSYLDVKQGIAKAIAFMA